MPKRPNAYFRPETLDEALRLMQQPNHVLLAGGTKLLAGDVEAAVVDLQGLGLTKIEIAEGSLVVGAMSRLAELEGYLQSEMLPKGPVDLLRRALRFAGPNTYRNAATLGGTIAARIVDSELLAALLALNAKLRLRQPAPVTVSLENYLAAPNDGLILEVILPWNPGQGGSERVARTPADTPIVSVTGWQPEDEEIRLAATGIDDQLPAVRLKAASESLKNGLTPERIEEAASLAGKAAYHTGDFRGDSTYRAEMASVLTRRLLKKWPPGVDAI